MTAINKGNVFVTSGTVSGDTITGGVTVEIDTNNVNHDFENPVIEFNIPVTPANDSTQAPQANIVDLKTIKHQVTVQGRLITDATSSAFEKKRDMMILAGYGGTAEDSLMVGQTIKSGAVTLVYGLSAQSAQHKVIGTIAKMNIKESIGREDDQFTSDTRTPYGYAVQFTLSVSKERKSA